MKSEGTLPKKHSLKYIVFYTLAIILGVVNGIFQTEYGDTAAQFFSDIFIRLFKFVSVPIIGVTICLTIAGLGTSAASKSIWKRTIAYTITTTLLAATVAAILYYVVSPANFNVSGALSNDVGLSDKGGYLKYFVNIIPDNILSNFVNGNILSILLIAIVSGIGIRYIKNDTNRQSLLNFLGGVQDLLFVFINWIIKLLPLGIFGFVSLCVKDFSSGLQLGGLVSYFGVVVGANIVQAFLILPLFLLIKGVNPLRTFKNMFKALSVAFFSKSSAATLPITMSCSEDYNGVNPKVSRFVLPICTTINMNGCAAFILITVMYLMQNNGADISLGLLSLWIFIATVAAIGNAGVPMGCYFLSASLLSSMDVPIALLGIILPVYTVLDMIETSLNVWSDSCVATAVNKDLSEKLEQEVNKA